MRAGRLATPTRSRPSRTRCGHSAPRRSSWSRIRAATTTSPSFAADWTAPCGCSSRPRPSASGPSENPRAGAVAARWPGPPRGRGRRLCRRDRHALAVPAHAVGGVDLDGVVTAATADLVPALAASRHVPIPATAEPVLPATAGDLVLAVTAADPVPALAAPGLVPAATAAEPVLPATAADQVVACLPLDPVARAAPSDHLADGAADERVAAVGPGEGRALATAADRWGRGRRRAAGAWNRAAAEARRVRDPCREHLLVGREPGTRGCKVCARRVLPERVGEAIVRRHALIVADELTRWR